jgi:uncharacterized protein YdhG (YjbR/CyaY superfamily)
MGTPLAVPVIIEIGSEDWMSTKRRLTATARSKAELPQTIDAYIADFPPDVQQRLQSVRRAILKAAPGAVEGISYRIPAFSLGGNFIFFAGFKKHIGLYPARVKELEQELAAYGGGKGTVQFPHDERLPLGLIARIVKHRVAEQKERVESRVGGRGKKGAVQRTSAKKATIEKAAAKKSAKK